MTELKFKLKQAGKCVGYLRIATLDGTDLLIHWSKDGSTWGYWEQFQTPAFDSIHPLVCVDRNKKEVYEGERVRIAIFDEVHGDGKAMLLARICQDTSAGPIYENPAFVDIELIEDQP